MEERAVIIKGKLSQLATKVDSLDDNKLETLDYLVKEMERQVIGEPLKVQSEPKKK